ncbi:hypothetical protein CR513_41617, partial [Mucuna pruriens]
MGKITLPTHIGPTTFNITFQALGPRCWGRSSSLHQKVKFIADQQLINVMGEKELMVSTPLLAEYVKGDEEALETSFQALEIVGTTSIETEGRDLRPFKAIVMETKVLINNGFQPGKGLGKELDGMTKPVAL